MLFATNLPPPHPAAANNVDSTLHVNFAFLPGLVNRTYPPGEHQWRVNYPGYYGSPNAAAPEWQGDRQRSGISHRAAGRASSPTYGAASMLAVIDPNQENKELSDCHSGLPKADLARAGISREAVYSIFDADTDDRTRPDPKRVGDSRRTQPFRRDLTEVVPESRSVGRLPGSRRTRRKRPIPSSIPVRHLPTGRGREISRRLPHPPRGGVSHAQRNDNIRW
jgi:hypothetical protein